MPPRFYDGGTVLVDGFRYDIGKMVDTTVSLINRLTEALGPCYVTLRRADAKEIPWPAPGRDVVRDVSKRVAQMFEAVDEPLIFVFEGIVLKAYLFGNTYCVHNRVSDALTYPDRATPIEGVDPSPSIQVWGKHHGGRNFSFADANDIARLDPHVRNLTSEGVIWTMSPRTADPGNDSRSIQFATLCFTHETFGDGKGPIRIRCTSQ